MCLINLSPPFSNRCWERQICSFNDLYKGTKIFKNIRIGLYGLNARNTEGKER